MGSCPSGGHAILVDFNNLSLDKDLATPSPTGSLVLMEVYYRHLSLAFLVSPSIGVVIATKDMT